MARERALETATFFSGERFVEDLTKRVEIRTESQNPEARHHCEAYLQGLAGDLGETLGCRSQVFANPRAGGGPILVSTREESPQLPTVLVYGHGDVVRGMEGSWSNGRSPWRVSIEGDRLYGRGTADNKGQHTIAMLALEAVLQTRGSLGFNTTFIVETSEETGSAGLHRFCELQKELLQADLLVASDGPRLSVDQPTVIGGTRGVLDFDLVCDLRAGGHHSGNWGGFIANPAVLVAHAIAALMSSQGQIQVSSLVPTTVSASMREALKHVAIDAGADGPAVEPGWGEPGLTPAERVFAWTALEVLAFSAGNPDQPVNAIPPRAAARCQIRYTVDTDPRSFLPAIRRRLDETGLSAVDVRPSAAGPMWNATRLDPDHWAAQWARTSIERTTGRVPVVIPNAGGSLPNDCFAEILDMPTVWIPHSYAGCCQHAPDEHLLMPLVEEGLAIMAGLFWDLGTDASIINAKRGQG